MSNCRTASRISNIPSIHVAIINNNNNSPNNARIKFRKNIFRKWFAREVIVVVVDEYFGRMNCGIDFPHMEMKNVVYGKKLHMNLDFYFNSTPLYIWPEFCT